MKSIWSQIYNGDLCPIEQFYPKSPEYTRCYDAFAESESELISILREVRPDLEAKYEEICDRFLEVLDLRGETMFRHSFCLGASLMLDILTASQRQG